jgi:DNA/RNA-binding domain of Phe-tRNA-synthetase-like protein
MQVTISPEIKTTCPELTLALISCEVQNGPTTEAFWAEMEEEVARIKSTFQLDEINKRIAIAATRRVYKALGKDPNRYRPSAEALCRRIVRDIPVYRVSLLVDIINLVSIRSGFSIGGFDLTKIQGDLRLGVGTADDEFEAIGRGQLNIEGLPVYRDTVGGIGTPTSDNERTKISDNTSQLLMIINGYSGKAGLQEAVDHTIELLSRHAALKAWKVEWVE